MLIDNPQGRPPPPAIIDLSELERRSLAKVKWRFFAYFFVGQLLLQLDKTNIGFAQLTMGKELSITAQTFGLAAGTFSLAAVFMQMPAAMFFEFFGARRWLTAIMLLWGSTCIAEAFVKNATQLIALRFLLGAFEAGFFPGLIIFMRLWFRGGQHGRVVGILQLGTAAAGIFGGPFAGWILGQALFGLAGWRNLFLWEGIATVAFAMLALIVLYDAPASARWLKSDERAFLSTYLARRPPGSSDSVGERTGVLQVLKDWRICIFIFSSASAGWIYGTFTFFSPTLLRMAGHGLNVRSVGLLSMGPYVIQAIVSLTWGIHSDRHGERHWHLVGPLAVGAVGVMLYPVLSTQPLLAMLCLIMVQGANAAFLVTFWPTVNMVLEQTTITRATALIQTGSQLGGFLAPIVFGWLMDASHGSTSLGLYESAAVFLLNFLVMNFFFFRYATARKVLPAPAA